MHALRERQHGIRLVRDERKIFRHREELVDLRLHFLQCGVASGRAVADHRSVRARRLPREVRGGVREERIRLRLVRAHVAAAVRHAAFASDDRSDRIRDRRVGRGLRRDDSVAVERLGVEDVRRACHVRQRYLRGVRLARTQEDVLERLEERLALVCRVVNVRKRD